LIPQKYKKYNPTYFDKGKRGFIFRFKKDKKDYSLKIKRPDSEAIERLKNEAKYLKILNKYGIGPKLVSKGKDYIVYEFVDGKLLKDIKLNKEQTKEILRQCFILDKLKLNKMEMHHPLKHIIINKKINLIDFERTYKTEKPKNVTQFLQFLKTNYKIRISLNLIREYKQFQNETSFNKILSSL